MKLSEMKQILTERQLRLTRSLGQNFLHDRNQLQRIVGAANLQPKDKVLEIGPGLGPLTELLLQHAGKVLAIEKDQRLVAILKQRFSAAPNLELLHADALDYVKEERDWHDWKVVSNLPYSVASPIIVELAQAQRSPELLVLTLQLEVAQRIAAKAGSDHYGLLSLLVQLRYEPSSFFKIPATCFFPEPDVDSGCIILARRSSPLLPFSAETIFTAIVKKAFSQRRKMMLKLLKTDWPEQKLSTAFAKLGLRTDARAETVSLDQFVQIIRTVLDESSHFTPDGTSK
jgi:16S rRNA (adenine1518-N6/adenine1519-N6)-dimethyltransferase